MSIQEEKEIYQNIVVNAMAIVNDLRRKIDPVLKDAIIAEKILRDTMLTMEEFTVKLDIYEEYGK